MEHPQANLHSIRKEKEESSESTRDAMVPTPVMRSLARYKWWILAAGLAGGLGLGAVAAYRPPSYTASALLLVEPSARNVLGFEAVTTDLSTEVVGLETQTGLLTSPPTLVGAAERLAALETKGRTSAEIADILAHRLVARSEGKGNILRVTLTAQDPAFAAAAVNAVADQFIAGQVQRKRTEIAQARDALAGRVTELEDAARGAERAVRDFRQTRFEAEESDAFYLERIAALEKQIVEMESELPVRAVRDYQRIVFFQDVLKAVRADYERFQDAELALKPLEANVAAAQQILGKMRGRFQEVAEQATFVVPDTVVVSAATPPTKPSSPSRELLGLIGFATFSMLAALSAVAIDQMRDGGADRYRE